uniref:Formamidopyrimidine-DNA glycosylase n=1 Tax=Magnetococcus massalia (strain MO-1) TaxID=451514 RepID=A0A1S7LKB1_MAGMO|nr:formamidopyrimidine/5-formyluracil/ 5-hydroxymethyluracil DNA glycosylase [Candidatus Magnetococcus massalia]
MPELPEVETTLRGIETVVSGEKIAKITVRQPRLRWPIPEAELQQQLVGAPVTALTRRAKYILWHSEQGVMLMHLGMSGSLRILPEDEPAGKHDHVDIVMESGSLIRFNDPRRFGALLWLPATEPYEAHSLLARLGPEPLGDQFSGAKLYAQSRGKKGAVKNFIMDQSVVVGVGNIYASESLFRAGILPTRPAGKVSKAKYLQLAEAIRAVLTASIEQGGTTLRDFHGSDGKPGYFVQSLSVYGRAGEACPSCGAQVQKRVVGQRSTFFCKVCQR